MDRKFYLIITGPTSIVENGLKVEELIITQEDIEEAREEDESDEDVINYIIDDEAGGWEQHFCRVQVLDEKKYKKFLEEIIS
jgi:hypothetical protein